MPFVSRWRRLPLEPKTPVFPLTWSPPTRARRLPPKKSLPPPAIWWRPPPKPAPTLEKHWSARTEMRLVWRPRARRRRWPGTLPVGLTPDGISAPNFGTRPDLPRADSIDSLKRQPALTWTSVHQSIGGWSAASGVLGHASTKRCRNTASRISPMRCMTCCGATSATRTWRPSTERPKMTPHSSASWPSACTPFSGSCTLSARSSPRPLAGPFLGATPRFLDSNCHFRMAPWRLPKRQMLHRWKIHWTNWCGEARC